MAVGTVITELTANRERVGTMNMRGDVPTQRAATGLARFLELIDIGGLQEWGPDRNAIARAHTDFVYAKPARNAPPVMARKNRYRVTRDSAVVLAGGRAVEPVPGRRTLLPDVTATLVHLTEVPAGDTIAVLNWHLPAHVEYRGLYRRLRDQVSGRAAMHRQARRQGRRLMHRVAATVDRVYIVGDTNYDLMRVRGFVSCWARHRPLSTLGRRTVDTVYTTRLAGHVETIKTASDHRAVVATYGLGRVS